LEKYVHAKSCELYAVLIRDSDPPYCMQGLHKFSKNLKRYLKFLDARKLTWSKFLTDCRKILGAAS